MQFWAIYDTKLLLTAISDDYLDVILKSPYSETLILYYHYSNVEQLPFSSEIGHFSTNCSL